MCHLAIALVSPVAGDGRVESQWLRHPRSRSSVGAALHLRERRGIAGVVNHRFQLAQQPPETDKAFAFLGRKCFAKLGFSVDRGDGGIQRFQAGTLSDRKFREDTLRFRSQHGRPQRLKAA